MASVSLSDVLHLPVPERLRLAEAIWDSIAAEPDALALSEADRRELDRRLDAYEQDPSAGRTWDEIEAKLGRS